MCNGKKKHSIFFGMLSSIDQNVPTLKGARLTPHGLGLDMENMNKVGVLSQTQIQKILMPSFNVKRMNSPFIKNLSNHSLIPTYKCGRIMDNPGRMSEHIGNFPVIKKTDFIQKIKEELIQDAIKVTTRGIAGTVEFLSHSAFKPNLPSLNIILAGFGFVFLLEPLLKSNV